VPISADQWLKKLKPLIFTNAFLEKGGVCGVHLNSKPKEKNRRGGAGYCGILAS